MKKSDGFKLIITAKNIGALTPAAQARIAANRRFLQTPSYQNPGVYVQTFSGHPYSIAGTINAFHKRMNRDYNGYTVLDTTSYTMPDGVCIYVTYQIGTPRNMPTQTAWPRY